MGHVSNLPSCKAGMQLQVPLLPASVSWVAINHGSTRQPHRSSVSAAVAAIPAPLLADDQEDGLHKLRLLAPQLLVGVPTRLAHLHQPQQQQQQQQQHNHQQQQQQGLFQLDFLVDDDDSWEDDVVGDAVEHHCAEYAAPQSLVSNNVVVAPAQHSSKAVAGPQKSSSSSRVHAKQLMGSIQAAATVSELQVLYDQHQASLDPIATAALLNRLAHTWSGTVKQAQHTRKQQLQQAKRRKQQQQSTLGSSNTAAAMLSARQHRRTAVGVAQPAAAADSYQPAANQAGYEQAVLLLRRLLALCVRHIPRYSSRQLSSALWVVGRFHRAAAAHDDIPQAAAAMLRALLVHQPQQQQQHQQRRRVSDQAAASAPVCLLQRDGNTADLQNVMWAVGRLAQVTDVRCLLPQQQHRSSSSSSSSSSSDAAVVLLDQLCSAALSARGKADGQFVANCLYGFAHMGVPAPALFGALVSRANPNYCKHLQSQHVVVIAWAAAKLGHHTAVLYDRLLWRAVVVRQALYPQGAAMLLAACARVKHTPDARAVAHLVQVCKAQWWKLRGKHLANLIYGLMGTHCLQHHRAFFMGVLLCQVTVKLTELSPLATATVLQALLQVTRPGPQHTPAQLSARHNLAQGTVQALETDCSGACSSSSGMASNIRVPGHGTGQQVLDAPLIVQDSRNSKALPRLRVSTAAAARAQIGLSAALSGEQGDTSSQLALLLRQMGVHIMQQLPETTSQTLYNTTVCLAGVGYYEPRLYTKLAAAVAAAAAAAEPTNSTAGHSSVHLQPTRQQQRQEKSCCVYSSEQCLQLLRAFSCFHHAAPELWRQLLPPLTVDAANLTDQQLVQVLAAAAGGAAGAGLSSGPQLLGAAELQRLMQLADAALQRQKAQQAPSVAGQLQARLCLAAACSALALAAATQQQQQQQHANGALSGGGAAMLGDVCRRTDRLLGQVVAVVCSQPQLMPWASLLKLLHASLTLHSACTALTQLQLQQHAASSSSSSSSTLPGWQPLVGPRVVQQLARFVQDHPTHLASGAKPQDLVLLLQCATHPALNTHTTTTTGSRSTCGLSFADAYAEQLLHCVQRFSVQTLVLLLQVLAQAWQQQGERRYGHVGLVSAAARQLHSKVRLATTSQLAAAVAALDMLQQQETPLYRTAARLLTPSARFNGPKQ